MSHEYHYRNRILKNLTFRNVDWRLFWADNCFRREMYPAVRLDTALALAGLAQSSDNSLYCPTDTNCFTRKTNFIFAWRDFLEKERNDTLKLWLMLVTRQTETGKCQRYMIGNY